MCFIPHWAQLLAILHVHFVGRGEYLPYTQKKCKDYMQNVKYLQLIKKAVVTFKYLKSNYK